ncbi:MAG: hypothetical protein HYV09_41380 [Deltaproteobacteria bacterium]|nr:hypothetical protein [Deltaproteobacteria bacterium]
MRLAIATVLLTELAALGCAGGTRRFPLRDPLWQDDDERPFAGPPSEYWSPLAWDAADKTIFLPVSEALSMRPGGEAWNVNALDEVPDSSWFHARAGRRPLSREDLAQGACKGRAPLSTDSEWVVVSAKPNGANPGFVIEAADGRKFLVKFEVDQAERATAGDAIGSRVYWAAGFETPCNTVVFMKPDVLRIAPDAKIEEGGEKVKLERRHLDPIFEAAPKAPDGTFRASASLFFDAKPLGPWTYEGRRDDDPNDVVPHDDRREVRAGYVLGAWLNHFDAREQNTMALWIEPGEKGRGFVRHAMLDWGDCFGSIWEWDALTRRLGHSHYLDFQHVAEDFVTLGLLRRPWHDVKLGPSGRVLGYFDADHFTPDAWRPGYPNPAFGRMTERDAAWMARIIAKIDEAAVDAMIDEAKVRSPVTDGELRRILKARRAKILQRWLGRLSPLTSPEISAAEKGALCMEDLVVTTGLSAPKTRGYSARGFVGDSLSETAVAAPTISGDGRVCAAAPRAAGASKASPKYVIVDLFATSPGFGRKAPARVHLYDLGDALRIVGLERPGDDAPPRP